jgi:hypothetical protein
MSETYDLPGVGPAGPPGAVAGSAAGPEPGPEPDPGPGAGTDPEPEPLGVVLAETGNAEVDTAVERLRDADGLPVHGHIEVYEDVHRGLRDALTALDEYRG